jgi:uncharacterized protein YegL
MSPAYLSNESGSQIIDPRSQLQNQRNMQPALTGSPELGFVLDRSSSMHRLVTEAVNGCNTLVAEQRATNPQALFSLSLFDDEIMVVHDAVPLAGVPELTPEFYVPRGSTALNDGIGSMIQAIGKRARRFTRVLIAILTDGAENVSRSFSEADILSMVTYRRTTYDWQFVFIGPESALGYALSIGIPRSNIVSFDANSAGIESVMKRLSKSVSAYQLGDRRYALKLRNL